MARLHGRFRRLYGDDADRCLRRLEMLVGRYGVGVGAERDWPLLDERSTLLVAHADVIRSEPMRPLVALRNFVERRLRDAFGGIHLLPFQPCSSEDSFAVVNYREVDPDLGNWSHVERLGRSFDLVFDLVLNHVSSRSDWFKEYVSGIAPASRYFHEVEPETDLSAVVRARGGSLLRHTHTSRGERHVWATFGQDQIDLNFANPDVLFEFLDILLLYIARGMRIVRLDAIAHLWKVAGSPCLHLGETHEIVKLFRDVIEIVSPGVLILADAGATHDENARYFGDGDEADLVSQSSLAPLTLHALLAGCAGYLRDWARSASRSPPGRTYVNVTESHGGVALRPVEGILPGDEIDFLIEEVCARGGSLRTSPGPEGPEKPYALSCAYFDALGDREGTEAALHKERFVCSQTIMLALRGVPAVYFDSLAATPGGTRTGDADGRPSSPGHGVWDENELDALIDDERTVTSQVFREYVRRLEARRQHAAFHPYGEQDVLDLGDALFGIRRTAPDGSEAVVAISNVTASPQTLELTREMLGGASPDAVYDVLRADGSSAVRDSEVRLEPYGSCWLRQEG